MLHSKHDAMFAPYALSSSMGQQSGINMELVHKFVQQIKINGIFDEMRKECLEDIDTKPAFLNLKQRVESHVRGILSNQEWSQSLNKNHLRSKIRESVMESGILNEGVGRILCQVFDAKAQSVFLPKIKDFILENASEILKDFVPPAPSEMPPAPSEIPPSALPLNWLPRGPTSPVNLATRVEMNDSFRPPMPDQPPPPELANTTTEKTVSSPTMQGANVTPKAILINENQDFHVSDEIPEGQSTSIEEISVSAKETAVRSEVDNEEEGPKIPEEVVNPLRSLIQSLLVSKQTLDSEDNKNLITDDGKATSKDSSPGIDESKIESFTDDENNGAPSHELYSPKPFSHSRRSSQFEASSPGSCKSDAFSPSSTDTPSSPTPLIVERSVTVALQESDFQIEKELQSPINQLTPPYDPGKFSYQQMSDSSVEAVDFNSPPSPIDGVECGMPTIESDSEPFHGKPTAEFNIHAVKMDNFRNHPSNRVSSTSECHLSSSDESDHLSAAKKEVLPEKYRGAEPVVEMVEEIEIVEEYISDSEKSGSRVDVGKKMKKMPKAYQDKKKKKSKKRKEKDSKMRKRTRTSSISSGEITSSNSETSDSNQLPRPPRSPRRKPSLHPLEAAPLQPLRGDTHTSGPCWSNTASSSEYLSSPRIHHQFSPPPHRTYSPEFRCFENDRDRGIPFPPPLSRQPLRERPMYGEYRSRSRFSPRIYHRSPPHRYSAGGRIEYPRLPFISPRSPPRRSFSPPPHLYHNEPRSFHPAHHRWSPPRAGVGHRRLSRSPPPPMLRREEGPAPSRY